MMNNENCRHKNISKFSYTGDEDMDMWGCDDCSFRLVPLTQKLRDLNNMVVTPIGVTVNHPQRTSGDDDDVMMEYIKKALVVELSGSIVDILYARESFAVSFYPNSTKLNIGLTTNISYKDV